VRRAIRLGSLSCLTLALLNGCLSLAPDYHRPDLPIANDFPTGEASTADSAATLAWRSFYQDPQMQALIVEALTNNRDLQIAAQRVEEARAIFGIQRADQFPNFAVGASGARARVPGDLNITGESQLQSEYQAGLNLAPWELDFWGRVRSLKDAAKENFMAAESAQRAADLSLIAQVADAYLRLRELDGRLQLTRETVATRTESFRIFSQRVAVGATSRLDLVQVETLLRQSELLQAQLEQARATQLNLLTLLVGKPLELSVSTTDLGVDATADFPVGLSSEVLTQRPDIVATEHQLKAAHANIGAARAAFFPRVTLMGDFGSASPELGGLFDSGSRAWSFVPSLSLPIFEGGRNRSNLDLAEARRHIAVAQYEKTIQQAFREVADELAARHWLDRQNRILQAELTAQQERVKLAQMRYDNGAVPYLVVLDAQRDLLNVGQQVIQTRRERISSQLRLYNALGGGSAVLVDTSAKTPD